MKNILILKTFPLTLKDWNNVGIITRELKIYNMINNSDNDLNFSLLSYGSKEDLNYLKYLGKINLILPFKNLNISNLYIKFILSFFIPFFLKKKIKKFDIIQTNQFRGSWIAIISKFLYNKKIVIRIGFEYFQFQKKLKKNFFYLAFLKLYTKFVYNYSNKIIVTTKDIKKYIIEEFSIEEEKIFVISNYIDTDLFKKNSNIKKKNLLFIGRLNPQKNLVNTFKALKNLDIVLDIIGHGDRSEYLKLANKLKIKVNFINNKKNDELPFYYNSCKIFILCSNFEGNPKTLLEAMSCECPILCSNVDGIKNLVNSSNAVVVNTDVPSISSGLKLLLENTKLRNQLSANSRKSILENNSITIIKKKIIDFYKNIDEYP